MSDLLDKQTIVLSFRITIPKAIQLEQGQEQIIQIKGLNFTIKKGVEHEL